MGVDHTYRYINASGIAGKIDLLWTNPNPSAAFAAQKLALDLTNYDGVLILGKYFMNYPSGIPTQSDITSRYISPGFGYTSIVYIWKGIGKNYFMSWGYFSSEGSCAGRPINSIDDTGIDFGGGLVLYRTYGHRYDDGASTPCKIWGVKHGGALSF